VDSLGRAADIYQVYTGQRKLEALINQMLLYVVSQSPVAAAQLANYEFNGERNRAMWRSDACDRSRSVYGCFR
jgi:hypothetical protein